MVPDVVTDVGCSSDCYGMEGGRVVECGVQVFEAKFPELVILLGVSTTFFEIPPGATS